MGDTRKYRNIDALRTFGCLAIIAWHVKANTGFSTGGGLDKVIPSFDYLVYQIYDNVFTVGDVIGNGINNL